MEKLFATITRSPGSATSSTDGAAALASYTRREYTSSEISHTPCLRHSARMLASSACVAVQPVGLFGEFRMQARAPSSSASNRSKSRLNRPSGSVVSPNSTTSAWRSRAALPIFGQAGLCSTTRSPARTIAASATDTAAIPEAVICTRDSATGLACSAVR